MDVSSIGCTYIECSFNLSRPLVDVVGDKTFA